MYRQRIGRPETPAQTITMRPSSLAAIGWHRTRTPRPEEGEGTKQGWRHGGPRVGNGGGGAQDRLIAHSNKQELQNHRLKLVETIATLTTIPHTSAKHHHPYCATPKQTCCL